MNWGNLNADAEDQSYWDLLVLYLLVGAVLGDCDLYRRMGRALDDGRPEQIKAELASFEALPPRLKARVRKGDAEFDLPLQRRSPADTDRYWALLMLYLQVGAVLGECELFKRMGAALDDGSEARVEAELVHFETLPESVKTRVRSGECGRCAATSRRIRNHRLSASAGAAQVPPRHPPWRRSAARRRPPRPWRRP